jgi:hypothetical protein
MVVGLHETKTLDKKTIQEYAEKNKIPAADNFELDSMYIRFINSIDTLRYPVERKNHYQPLQALYYDQQGKLQAFIINCYARGFPNLKWNRGGIFDTFLPKQQAPVDSILPLYEHLKFIRPLPGAQRFVFGQNEYTIIVYWNHFMGRQSRHLVEEVQKNLKLAGNRKVRVIYVNNDNFFAKYF